MMKRGPWSRPQASEGEAQHGPFCWTGRFGQGDEWRWNGVPRGTMDEVSSHVRLDPPVRLTARPPERLFHLVFESHDGRALAPIPKRSTSPRATSTLPWWIV